MITDIIDTLSDDNKSLTTPLLKVKVLASRIGNTELLNWVNSELDGYKNADSLPDYRVAKSIPRGNMQQGYHQENNVTLPIMIFGESLANKLIRFHLDQGVKALENLSNGESGDTLTKQFGADFCAFLTEAANKNGQRITITHAWVELHISDVIQVLAEIRSKLLDLLLKLETEYPNLESDLKTDSLDKSQVNQTIIHVMNNFNTSGDGNIVNTGNENTFNTNITINKGSIDELKAALREIAVPEEDIQEIEEIVTSESPNLDQKTFGQRTNEWLQKMIGKTLNKSWDVSTGAAAGVLTELLKNYFGM